MRSNTDAIAATLMGKRSRKAPIRMTPGASPASAAKYMTGMAQTKYSTLNTTAQYRIAFRFFRGSVPSLSMLFSSSSPSATEQISGYLADA